MVMNRKFTKQEIQVANEHIKRCLLTAVIRIHVSVSFTHITVAKRKYPHLYQVLVRIRRNRDTHTLLVGTHISTVT